MRGNFVDVPTDCPQRDERLGWTGDLQVFAPTATFLYDVGGFLADWLDDLRAEPEPRGRRARGRALGGPRGEPWGFPAAAWGDAATVVPWVLHERYDDTALLARQFDSMRAGSTSCGPRPATGTCGPRSSSSATGSTRRAPPDQPWRAQTDAVLVASAYFARSAQIVADAAAVLGLRRPLRGVREPRGDVRAAFRDDVRGSERPHQLRLPDRLRHRDRLRPLRAPEQRAASAARLALLFEAGEYRIATGFVGTPLVLPALSAMGDTRTAYRLLTETACPSWLYPVTMGATTVWERWDSMLPDGSINPGEMTSFNHYALGSVADWMHQVIGGIAPAAPGYRELRIAPVPGSGRHVGRVHAADALRHRPVPLVDRRHPLLTRRAGPAEHHRDRGAPRRRR